MWKGGKEIFNKGEAWTGLFMYQAHHKVNAQLIYLDMSRASIFVSQHWGPNGC